jgi:hypothetical protein
MKLHVAGVLAAAAFMAAGAGAAAPAPLSEGVPRYDHVFVIVEENKNYAMLLDPALAPNLNRLAREYGSATQFFGEVHPSEANYVALVGGDTFGIFDDDAFYCKARSTQPFCTDSTARGYRDHTIHARHLGDQLTAAGLSWKGYYESLPEPGSLAITASDPKFDNGTRKTALYASKHSGFINFADVQADPKRADKIVGFAQFDHDLESGDLPNFALIVPNQCNEMHGLHGDGVPADCDGANPAALIRRGDAYTGELVKRIQGSPAWRGTGNAAIVITFDESGDKGREGCCAVTPSARSNFGGGHIPTIVITNHGPRGVTDDQPCNHYCLLRTFEDAFGVRGYLRHAGDTGKGVRALTKLFAAPSPPG